MLDTSCSFIFEVELGSSCLFEILIIKNTAVEVNSVLNEEELPIEENVNRLQIDGASARNVDDAIHVLE
jgi:hypothetical protein